MRDAKGVVRDEQTRIRQTEIPEGSHGGSIANTRPEASDVFSDTEFMIRPLRRANVRLLGSRFAISKVLKSRPKGTQEHPGTDFRGFDDSLSYSVKL